MKRLFSTYDDLMESLERLSNDKPSYVTYEKIYENFFRRFKYDRAFVNLLQDDDILKTNKFMWGLNFTPMGRHIYMQRLRKLED